MQKLILFLAFLFVMAPAFAQNCPDPDTLPPVLLCHSGLLVGVNPTTCGVVLPVETVLDSVQDDCSPVQDIQLSLREAGTGTGFPWDSAGNPVLSVSLYLPAQQVVVLELWARDAAGNTAYCQATINVWDSEGDCMVDVYSAGGAIRTDTVMGGQGVEDVLLTLEAAAPTFPPFSLYQQTGSDGHFLFSNVLPENTAYKFTPSKNDNPLNGVTTYDLVLISRHILGLEPLNSPYKIIAADANRSGTVTTIDIITLRKLILGLTDDLPGNTSWRFVDREFTFPNLQNPFQTIFPEWLSDTIDGFDLLNDDFVGLKVGDVNGTAAPNSNYTASDDRTDDILYFDLNAHGDETDPLVEAGERFSVQFSPAAPVFAFQFTLNTTSLEVLDIQPGIAMSPDCFAVFPEKSAVTVSWNEPAFVILEGSVADHPNFTATFRATQAARLSDLLSISNRITKAEGYQIHPLTASHRMNKLDIALRLNQLFVIPETIELEQNEPNPFTTTTSIGFHLPEAGVATFTVFDGQGRHWLRKEGFYEQGSHKLKLDGISLPAGLLYYRMETAAGSAGRKMMLIR